MCEYDYLITSLSVKAKVITPGYLIGAVDPCTYDSILAERMVREAFNHAQEHRDFIKGATSIMPFKDYLRIV
jgi:6-phosphofructokinase 1